MTTSWRLDVVKHGPRLLTAAREEMTDENEAHLFVHRVISGALRADGDSSQRRHLDTSLGRMLRAHAAERALFPPAVKI